MSFCFKFEAHPGVRLIDHLTSVGNESKRIVKSKKLNLPFFDIITNLSILIGFCHDFGKASSYFQKYIKNESTKIKNKNELKNHSRISALFGMYASTCYITDILSDINSKNSKNSEIGFDKNGLMLLNIMPAVVYLIINRHHGNLKDLSEEINYIRITLGDGEESDLAIIFQQLNSMKADEESQCEIDEIVRLISKSITTKLSIADFSKFIGSDNLKLTGKSFSKILNEVKNASNADTSFMLYYITELLYSILLYCDKEHAIFHEFNISEKVSLSADIIDRYYCLKKYNCPQNSLDEIRNKYYNAVTSKAGEIDLNEYIYSINMPTGTGKTLTSVSFALKLKARLMEAQKTNYKIIYCLPFISVIDQNYGVMLDVLNKLNIIGDSQKIIKYHSLADAKFEKNRSGSVSPSNFEDEYEDDNTITGAKAKFLLENWRSEFVFTTFVQFFDSFFTNRNSTALRFHNMANSIVILDEIQNIPNKFWKIINITMNFLARFFNIYFILSTATLPLIFSASDNEISELTFPVMSDKVHLMPERIKIDVNDLFENTSVKEFKKTTLEELAIHLSKVLNEKKFKSALIVLNTIESSLFFYDLIKNKLEYNEINHKYELIYLSTNIIPKERMARIDKIKDSTFHAGKVILVSTQMVEAGVDIDFEYVIRDMAPLDSINQVGGRCNRNFRNSVPGILKLLYLYDKKKEKRNIYSKLIYDSVLLDKTKECLIEFKDNNGYIKESQFSGMAYSYFNKVRKSMSEAGISDTIMEYIKKLKFSLKDEEDEIDLFKLINEAAYERNVFIEVDERAADILAEYNKIKCIKNRFERKDKFETIRKDFLSYVISVPKNKINDSCDDENDLVIITKNELLGSYDHITGFIRNKHDLII